MNLPLRLSWDRASDRWASILNPFLQRPVPIILENVSLISGSNTINHLLGHKLHTWKIVRQRAQASIYDNQDANQMQDLTLVLVSDAPVVVDIEVA